MIYRGTLKTAQRRAEKKPPRLMARINRGGHILLTEADIVNQPPRLIGPKGPAH